MSLGVNVKSPEASVTFARFVTVFPSASTKFSPLIPTIGSSAIAKYSTTALVVESSSETVPVT